MLTLTPPASKMQRFRPAALSFRHAASSGQNWYARAAKVGATQSKPKSDDSLSLSGLVKLVATELNYEADDVKTVTDALLNTIVQNVAAGKNVKLQGFGTFKRVETAARAGRNPATGQPLQIAASARASFASAKNFKDTVKEAYKKSG